MWNIKPDNACGGGKGSKATLYLYDHRSAGCPNSQQFHSRNTVHINFPTCSCICRCCGLGHAALLLAPDGKDAGKLEETLAKVKAMLG